MVYRCGSVVICYLWYEISRKWDPRWCLARWFLAKWTQKRKNFWGAAIVLSIGKYGRFD